MSLKTRARAFFRSASEEALGSHMNRLNEAGETAANVGRLLALENQRRDLPHLRDYGFRVFSQFGEDGILQHLTHRLGLRDGTFVEIGVEDYSESNTRFLAVKDDWRGLIVDAGDEAAGYLARSGFGMRRGIVFERAFVTAESVEEILARGPAAPDLLSIDVDGMDLWIWSAVESVRPVIVVCEFNGIFGAEAAVAVPYDPAFDRMSAHGTGLLYGASLAALEAVGRGKGYALVGTSDGPNAFFVREDRLGPLRPATARECFRTPSFRPEPGPEPHAPLAEARIVDVATGAAVRLGDVPGFAPGFHPF